MKLNYLSEYKSFRSENNIKLINFYPGTRYVLILSTFIQKLLFDTVTKLIWTKIHIL